MAILEQEQPSGLNPSGVEQARDIDPRRYLSVPLVAGIPVDLMEADGLDLVHQRAHRLA